MLLIMLFAVGVKGIFTAHGSSMNDVISNPILKKLDDTHTFERILLIDENRNIHLAYKKETSD